VVATNQYLKDYTGMNGSSTSLQNLSPFQPQYTLKGQNHE
jgi:hypothetical protein